MRKKNQKPIGERLRRIIEILPEPTGKPCGNSGVCRNLWLGVWMCRDCGEVFLSLEEVADHFKKQNDQEKPKNN